MGFWQAGNVATTKTGYSTVRPQKSLVDGVDDDTEEIDTKNEIVCMFSDDDENVDIEQEARCISHQTPQQRPLTEEEMEETALGALTAL